MSRHADDACASFKLATAQFHLPTSLCPGVSSLFPFSCQPHSAILSRPPHTHTPAPSAACCLYELYTGSPLFPGVDNNDMLWLHQSLKGRFPHRMLRFHLRQVEAYGFEAHFAPDLRFKRALQDPVSRAPITKMVDITTPSTDLGAALLAKRAADDDKRAVLALRDLLEAMLALDPAKRISVRDAMNHPFIRGSGSASGSATASSGHRLGHGHGHGHGHGYGHRDGGSGSGR